MAGWTADSQNRLSQFSDPTFQFKGYVMHMPEADTNRRDVCSRVLCIDADPGNRTMVKVVLAAYPSIELRIAVNGHSGVRAVRTAMPDLILLNMSLPDMGGMEVVRALQPDMADGSCQVIALTAEAFSIDIVKALSLGVREYWLKPLRCDLLKSDLARVLNTSMAKTERAASRTGWLTPHPAAPSA
jgi:CheY-like chemotaxis protein